LASSGKCQPEKYQISNHSQASDTEENTIVLPKPHAEGVQVLVDLIEGCDGLNDVVVLLLNAVMRVNIHVECVSSQVLPELDFSSRVGVTQTQDGAVNVAWLKLLDKLAAVLAQTTEQIRDDFGGVAGFACEVGESRLDATRQVPLADTKGDGLLLSSLGEVRLKRGPQEVRHDAFGDIVDLGERILGTLERRKADELDRLSEFIEILHGLLHFGEAAANGVGLEDDLEDGIADGAFV
jgi:hypothetical protein